MKIAKKDLEILNELRCNARVSLTQVSKKTHVPISTLYDRLRMLEKSSMVRHVSIVNFEKAGYTHRSCLIVRASKNMDAFVKFIKKENCVNNFNMVDNKKTFIIETVHKDMKSFVEFKDKIKDMNIEILHDFPILEEIKRESFTNFK